MQFPIPEQKKNFYSAVVKNNFKNAFVVFYENSFIAAAYALKYE